MSPIGHELRLFLRARLAAAALLLLALLAAASVAAGLAEVRHQRQVIERVQPQQAADVAAIADWVSKIEDPGSAAYYTFHPTWDSPSSLAFAALGMRDVAPYILRVRALGLEAQLYDGEAFNPELALPGRFDFSFVLVYLAPLFVIALFHDLWSSEREAGRLMMLKALSRGRRLWWRRGLLRLAFIYVALALPFLMGAALSGATALPVFLILLLIAAYLAFWAILAAIIGRLGWSSATNAAALAACWLVLTLVLPTLSHIVINRAIPVGQGVELTLAQREAVNRAWDIPREETMERFFARHPEWRDTPPLPVEFHWKWYFAFHQVGDESVEDQVRAYRDGLEARDAAARALGWVLPPVGAQTALARLAGTDLDGQLAYQDRIRAYHKDLRQFYYGYLFDDLPFRRGDFAKAPGFGPDADERDKPALRR
jgi:ABC-2 type transport system permease protein